MIRYIIRNRKGGEFVFQFDKKLNFSASELDVLAVGEVLVDIISSELVPSFKEAASFDRYFGGSPANIVMNTRQLGAKTALISKVGADGLGDFLLGKLKEREVDTRGVIVSPQHNTSVVLVTQSKESPEFLAYREADKNLRPGEIEELAGIIKETKIIHLSTFALSAPQTRKAMLKAVEIAERQEKIISLDPNYRPQLWEGPEDGQQFIKDLLARINIVKPSLDDAEALFGSGEPEDYLRQFHQAGVELVILTLGADGVLISTGQEMIKLDSFATEVIDTTGAGDAFWSGLYASLVDGDCLTTAVKVGNAAASLALRQIGALAELPEKDKIINQFKLKEE